MPKDASAEFDNLRYKICLLLKRGASLDTAQFSERWLAASRPSWPDSMAGYVHNRTFAGDMPIENAPAAPYDAVDEFLFKASEDALDWLQSRAFKEDFLAPRRHMLSSSPEAISGSVTSVFQQAVEPPSDSVKILTLPVRRQGMTQQDFARHWLVTHAGLALAGSGTKERLLRLASAPADRRPLPGLECSPFDGIGVIQFVSISALREEFASAHYRNVLAPDELRFTDPLRSRAMLVRETVVA